AVKYTPKGGKITIKVAIDIRRNVVVLRVQDTGIGIPPELLPRVFDIFVQADDVRSGLGVGLNLVRRIVELHHGTVRDEREVINRGSVFTVELPLMHQG